MARESVKIMLNVGKGSVSHNQGSCKSERSKNVKHPERTKDNVIVDYTTGVFERLEWGSQELRNRERACCARMWGASHERKNASYRGKGTAKRKLITTMTEYTEKNVHEVIGSISNGDARLRGVTKDEDLEPIVRALIVDVEKRCPNIKVLNYAIHFDEETAHFHIRYAASAINKFGEMQANQSEALKWAGFFGKSFADATDDDKEALLASLRDTRKPENMPTVVSEQLWKKYNNPLVEFTAYMRGFVQDEAERMGYSVDRTVNTERKNRTKAQAREEALAKREAALKAGEASLEASMKAAAEDQALREARLKEKDDDVEKHSRAYLWLQEQISKDLITITKLVDKMKQLTDRIRHALRQDEPTEEEERLYKVAEGLYRAIKDDLYTMSRESKEGLNALKKQEEWAKVTVEEQADKFTSIINAMYHHAFEGERNFWLSSKEKANARAYYAQLCEKGFKAESWSDVRRVAVDFYNSGYLKDLLNKDSARAGITLASDKPLSRVFEDEHVESEEDFEMEL